MGDPRKIRRKYATPSILWNKERIIEESKLQNGYGLKSKKEVWRAKAVLAKLRSNARKLLAKPVEERKAREQELLSSLARKGVLQQNATLDDVLALKVEAVLERRLQTQVWKQGLSATVSQARQFIKHGHVELLGKKVTSPGIMLGAGKEHGLKFTGSPLMVQARQKEETKEGAEKASRIEKLKSVEADLAAAQDNAQVEKKATEGEAA